VNLPRQKPDARIGTSLIFLNPSNQVLLLLRDNNKGIRFPNCWDVPGGNLEGSETPQECIQREMREEMELEVGDAPLFHVYDLTDRLEYTFWQRADVDIAALPLHEGQGLRWFSENEIRSLPDDKVAFGFKAILLGFFREQPWSTD
jgi:8-oxo-dGTP diphosphatase